MINFLDKEKCTGCGECFKSCSLDVFRINTNQQDISPCMNACPAGIDIRGYNALLQLGKIHDALVLLKKSMPFPAITGRICHHPCEVDCGRCLVDTAVNINGLEHFLGQYDMTFEKTPQINDFHLARIAIVGSGPASLSCAWFMALRGYGVTVYEAKNYPGGMLRYGIPANRLPESIVDSYINKLKSLGVKFICNTKVGTFGDISTTDLMNSGYEAILLAPGCNIGKKVTIPGIENDGILSGLEFLEAIRSHIPPQMGKNVSVIGGGNVAIDSAISAKRLGAQTVNLICLESRETMPAFEHNIRDAIREGIRFHASWGPLSIQGKDSSVTGITCQRCVATHDDSGQFCPQFNPSEQKHFSSDTIIFAIGQSPDLKGFSDVAKITNQGYFSAHDTYLSSHPGVFFAGDALRGPSSVIQAIADGRHVASHMHAFLLGQAPLPVVPPQVASNLPQQGIQTVSRYERVNLFDKTTRGFNEQTLTFTLDEALGEAMRCLTCGGKAYIAYPDDCMTCYSCELRCPSDAVNVHPFKEILPRTLETFGGGKI